MEILHFLHLEDPNLHLQLKELLLLCNEDFIPPLSENRRTRPDQSIGELIDLYIAEKDLQHHYLLAVEDDRLIGFTNFETDVKLKHFPDQPKGVHVDTSCVHPDFRNRQVGQALYAFFEELVPTVTDNLFSTRSTWETNHRQIHLFEKTGYQRLGAVWNSPNSLMQSVYYTKPILRSES